MCRKACQSTMLLFTLLFTLYEQASALSHHRKRSVHAPKQLTTNGRKEPFDLENIPGFSWQVQAKQQKAYEIRVSSSYDQARQAKGDIWESGKVISNDQIDIPYLGPKLKSSSRYFWRVRIWSKGRRPSPWSKIAGFGMGPGSEWTHSHPIWAPDLTGVWRDYRVSFQMSIDAVAMGFRFRSPDKRNGYMWQFRSDDNQLVPHIQVNGKYRILEKASLPANTLSPGKKVQVTIELNGTGITTFIDGVRVHSTEDSTFLGGSVGVRTGRYEAFTLYNMHIVNLADGDAQTLFATEFNTGDQSFRCAKVGHGSLYVPRSSNCLNSGSNNDWVFLRKEFTLSDKTMAWATVYATASSPKPAKQYVYKLYINGRFVGLGPTQPLARESRYDGFDVSQYLNATGTNAIGILAYTTRDHAVQVELVVGYKDGTQQVVGSDQSWKALSGDYTFPDVGSIGTRYYKAPKENLDARYFPFGFAQANFDDSLWHHAHQASSLKLKAAAPMAKVQEHFYEPVEIVEKGEGHYFIDFGRTWVGGVSYTIANGIAGNAIELRFGEILSAPETVKYKLHTGNTYRDIVTTKEGSQLLETWGMRVFRYLEIIGAPEPVTEDKLKALALIYPFNSSAQFKSSDANLESVWQLSRNTIEALNVNFYTDSWTRERTNYEADAYLQMLSASYLNQDLSLGRYSIDYFKTHRTWPTEWPLYVIFAMHDAWLQTGSTRQILESYDDLQSMLPDSWFEPQSGLIVKHSRSNGCNSRTNCDIVDWPPSQRDGYVFREYNTVVNALAYRAYRNIAAIAAEIGRSEDALLYSSRADTLRESINRYLFDPETATYDDGLDASGRLSGHSALHASAFPLAFSIPELADKKGVGEGLAARGMACSVYCAPFLIRGLYQAELGQSALNLIAGTGISSWLNMIELGAGSTAEAWDPSMKGNLTFSHPWSASPAFLIPSGLFGIEPIEPGYESFKVKLQPGNLADASITVPTVRGPIGAAFKQRDGESIQIVLKVPGNSRASLSFPATASTKEIRVGRQRRRVSSENGFITLPDLGPGCYVVSTVKPDQKLAFPPENLCGHSKSYKE